MKTRRTVMLEILRRGLAYPQLLSPVTHYQALCGNHEAQRLHLPFEHYEFLQRMKALRYQDEDVERRAFQIRRTASDLAEVLRQVPGLIAELAQRNCSEEGVTHLRLVLSAPELALLPFELALGPPGFPAAGQEVTLQTVAPLSITREVRRMSGECVRWPKKPRILMAAASPPGVGDVPRTAHLLELRRAIAPWVTSGPDGATSDPVRDMLTVIPEASLEAIRRACSEQAFTHVHILAHGAPLPEPNKGHFGLALHDRAGTGRDIVDGRRLADALRAHSELCGHFLSSPVVVTVASCDSAGVRRIEAPGASVAHALHEAGVAFVVASQFPLTMIGSITMVRVLYQRLLWGDDPRVILHDLRQQLHQLSPKSHDWASLVAYAAFPPDFERQLEEARSAQSRMAMGIAMERAESGLLRQRDFTQDRIEEEQDHGNIKQALSDLDRAIDRMPMVGEEQKGLVVPEISDRVEKLGIRGSVEKRRAWVYWVQYENALAMAEQSGDEVDSEVTRKAKAEADRYRIAHNKTLIDALHHYLEGFELDMSTHWAGVQYLCLAEVIGAKPEPEEEHWQITRAVAEMCTRDQDRMQRAWAFASLLELDLLELYGAEDAQGKAKWKKEAKKHWDSFASEAPRGSMEWLSTVRQLRRYVIWWNRFNPDLKRVADHVRHLVGNYLFDE